MCTRNVPTNNKQYYFKAPSKLRQNIQPKQSTEKRAHHNLDSVMNNDGIDELTVAQQHGLTPNIQFVIPTYVRWEWYKVDVVIKC